MSQSRQDRSDRAAPRGLAALLAIALLAGCASAPPAEDADALAAYEAANDPLEPMNRAIFEFNRYADNLFIKPIAILYRDFIPPEPRRGVRNFLDNLRSPITLANDLLQGEIERASVTVQRFAVNSTAGIGGLMDVASDLGLPGHREDFGQTAAVWGSGEGFYLVLPILGPSNPRDAIGLVVDGFFDPLNYVLASEILVSRAVVRGIDERERVIDSLDEIERTSIDYYATLRSLYRQRRDDEIRNGRPAPIVPIPAISIEDAPDDSDKVSLAN